MRRKILAPVVAIALLFSAGTSLAQPQISSADKAAFKDFQLTDEFITNYLGYSEEAAKKPCELSPIMLLQNSDIEHQSLEDTIKAFDKQPGVHETLQRHNLTARTMILGLGTLMGAAMQDILNEHPELAQKGEMKTGATTSPENMAVYQHHKAAIQQHQMEVARQQMQSRQSGIFDCMK